MSSSSKSSLDDIAVESFKSFLRFPTVSNDGPNGVYQECVNWLKTYCTEAGFSVDTKTFVQGKPVLIATLPGSDVSLPSLFLNCHYDVVPVETKHWNYEPFAATQLENGDIVSRGTQDMKCVGIQYIEALRRLQQANKADFKRTIHVGFLPDEEIGGHDGICQLLASDWWKTLNVGVALDEGLANDKDSYNVYYAERSVWWVMVHASGPAGHGSQFIENTATVKLNRVINHILKFRDSQEAKLNAKLDIQSLKLGDVTSVNLTALKSGVENGHGGYNLNVIPTLATAGFDIRITPNQDMKEWEEMFAEWTAEEGVTVEHIQTKPAHTTPTSTNPEENEYWKAFAECMQEHKHPYELRIFPAATDGRYLRDIGIPVFGFSPMKSTPILFHCHDELLNVKTFLEGITVYEQLLPAIANV